jgi:hypothetical protein
LVTSERPASLRMNFGRKLEIQDLGNHSAVTVISLGILLAGTVNVTPDPKRKGFDEVHDGSTVYYVCASTMRAGGTIFLLATWRVARTRVAQLKVAARGRLRVVEPLALDKMMRFKKVLTIGRKKSPRVSPLNCKFQWSSLRRRIWFGTRCSSRDAQVALTSPGRSDWA